MCDRLTNQFSTDALYGENSENTIQIIILIQLVGFWPKSVYKFFLTISKYHISQNSKFENLPHFSDILDRLAWRGGVNYRTSVGPVDHVAEKKYMIFLANKVEN